MPIFDYCCKRCGHTGEMFTHSGDLHPCQCGGVLAKLPAFPAMVRIRGEGLYPSEIKHTRGTAPFTSGGNTLAWGEYDNSKYNMNGKLTDPDGKDNLAD